MRAEVLMLDSQGADLGSRFFCYGIPMILCGHDYGVYRGRAMAPRLLQYLLRVSADLIAIRFSVAPR